MTTVAHGLAYPRTRRRAGLLGDEPEAEFQRRVIKLARLYGWRDWHQLNSRGTRPGLPDLMLLRPPRLIFAEVKSQHGRTRSEQDLTLALLARCPGFETYLWRPSEFQHIAEVLR